LNPNATPSLRAPTRPRTRDAYFLRRVRDFARFVAPRIASLRADADLCSNTSTLRSRSRNRSDRGDRGMVAGHPDTDGGLLPMEFFGR
jgi:hypothetical protein